MRNTCHQHEENIKRLEQKGLPMLNKQNSKWKQNQRQKELITTGERVFRVPSLMGQQTTQRGSWQQKMVSDGSVASLKPPRHIKEKGYDWRGQRDILEQSWRNKKCACTFFSSRSCTLCLLCIQCVWGKSACRKPNNEPAINKNI